MVLVQQTNAAVIGNHNAVKAPALAQNRGQQEAVAVARLIVNVVVCGHHRTGVGTFHRHFKR